MKTKLSLLCLLYLSAIGFAQNKKIENADQLFNSYQYVDAISAYLQIIDDNEADSHVYKKLADSYYNVFNIDEASKWYKKALETNQEAETYYRYAQTLKSQGKYEMANEQMRIFSQMMPNDERAKTYVSNPNYIPKLADKTKLFKVEETTINDKDKSDFGAVLSNDNVLYFVSNRKKSKKQDLWTKEPYLDIYKSVRNDDGTLSEAEEVEELNTIYHDGPLTISQDGKTMYFSRDGHSEGSYKKIKNNKIKLAQQGIYKATLVDGKWKNIEALPINSKDYSVTHPSLSNDGKTLYFTSNMPGGLGDTDIWKISIDGNTYGKPKNLGPDVNTSGKEGFPYVSSDNILYFASSGRQGFGGFDIFKYDLNKKENTVNLGNGVNTKRDDFAFSVNTSKKIGFFSSNRSGVDNIYIAIPICRFEITTTVKNAENSTLIPGAKVSILDNQNNIIATQLTDKNGNTSFNLSCENTYTINVLKDKFETVTIPVKKSDEKEINLTASLQPINEIITDKEVKLNNIYFEFNKSNITQQGAYELDKLVKIMNDYPEMAILVRSHTDSKGNPNYNKKLSEKRAQATVQYLISKGIDKNRLSSEGLGSSEPKIDCKTNCNEEEDAKNRRSEFLIIKR